MVKRHRFRHHPLHIYQGLMLGEEEEYGGIAQGDLRTTITATETVLSTTGWTTLDLAGLNPPAAAVAAILDVAVNDADGDAADYYLQLATPGIIYASKTQIVYAGDVDGRWQSRLVIVEISDDGQIAIKVDASVGGFNYTIKLIGWILDPSVTRPSMPSEDLKATFFVNQ